MSEQADAENAGDDSGDPGDRSTGDRSTGGGDRVVVMTGQGMGVSSGDEAAREAAAMVEQPAKVMRIGKMLEQMLAEVREAPLDDAGRARLAAIHERSVAELEQGLSDELVAELHRITLPFSDVTPSDAELRVAQAQLVGWLEGLFHGIQAAVFAQQMAAQAQLQQLRRALPGGGPGMPGQPGAHPGAYPDQPPTQRSTGQYL